MTSPSLNIAIIGAGPAGLMAAEAAAQGGARVTIFERMPSPGRKFLLAGRGGLNLTHSEAHDRLLARYTDAAPHLAPMLAAFDAAALRAWCADLGIDTFVGTSGRVFPTALKTSPLLRAWLRRLTAANVRFAFRHNWRGWDGDRLRFETPAGETTEAADAVVLAQGGASWPQLGSDGAWTRTLGDQGIEIAPLHPANCGFTIAWSDIFRDRFEGEPLKNIALSFGEHRARGDAVVTRAGIEGGPVYALAAPLREAIARDGSAWVEIALRPDLPQAVLDAKLAKRQAKDSVSNMLRKTLGLAPVSIGLLREGASGLDGMALAQRVNAVPIRLLSPMPIGRAISTAGGVTFAGLDETLMLKVRPGVFVAGEMLDWEAPTGGYLLQASFATGRAAGLGALAFARQAPANVGADGRTSLVL